MAGMNGDGPPEYTNIAIPIAEALSRHDEQFDRMFAEIERNHGVLLRVVPRVEYLCQTQERVADDVSTLIRMSKTMSSQIMVMTKSAGETAEGVGRLLREVSGVDERIVKLDGVQRAMAEHVDRVNAEQWKVAHENRRLIESIERQIEDVHFDHDIESVTEVRSRQGLTTDLLEAKIAKVELNRAQDSLRVHRENRGRVMTIVGGIIVAIVGAVVGWLLKR